MGMLVYLMGASIVEFRCTRWYLYPFAANDFHCWAMPHAVKPVKAVPIKCYAASGSHSVEFSGTIQAECRRPNSEPQCVANSCDGSNLSPREITYRPGTVPLRCSATFVPILRSGLGVPRLEKT
mmetsp:Transcript_60004/g.107026  ORF Transcript_60004/g.107026 Transcript_60004/m.107026 type:complete len:124 (-) Transcript_60004:30-401(-)